MTSFYLENPSKIESVVPLLLSESESWDECLSVSLDVAASNDFLRSAIVNDEDLKMNRFVNKNNCCLIPKRTSL